MRFDKQMITLVLLFVTAGVIFGQEPSPSSSPAPSPEMTLKLKEFIPVNGIENWDYIYDVSNLPRGMYNIIVEGVDKAGNVFYSSPVNILIDPESDLPVASITNPVADMRVGNAMLNVVGTCIDDDAVAKVEVQIDGGDFLAAEGTEFWSFKLNTAGLEDGKHTIAVRGTDKNGVTGNPVVRTFHIDTSKPLTTITSHSGGVLLSGSKELEGTIEDFNGVTSLAYSINGGKTFQPLSFSYNQKEKKYHFQVKIDTTKLPDGPGVIWFKSIDGMKSLGTSAFLFFVDNKKPVIEVLAPKPDEKMNGKFNIVGRAQDEIGIKSLVYQHKSKTGEILLIPGNPYWFVEFDATGLPSGSESIKFTVTDITGNIVETETRIQIDNTADKPVVSIAWPKADSALGTSVEVCGFVDDDDAVEAVVWQLDTREPVTLPAKDGFSFPLEGLDPGKHTVNVYGIDVNKVIGDKASVTFTIPGSQSSIRIESVIVNGTTTNFMAGAEVGRFDKATLRGRITQFQPFKKVVYSIGGGKEQNLPLRSTAQKSQMEFDLNLPETIPYGIVEVRITAIDSLERTTAYASFVHVTNLSKVSEKPGFYMADVRLDAQPVTVSAEFPLRLFFVGDRVRNVALEPEVPQLKVNETDGQITITPAGEIDTATAVVRVTTINNENFKTEAITFTTTGSYFEDPLTRVKVSHIVTKTDSGLFYPGLAFASQDGQTQLDGSVASETAKVEFSFNNKDYKAANYSRNKADATSTFSFLLPGSLPYGYNEVYIRSSDEKNRSTLWKTFFYKIDSGSASQDEPGLYFLNARTEAGGEITLTQDDPFSGYCNGREIKTVNLNPPSSFLKASFNGNFIVVEALSEGQSGPTIVEVVTVNNQTYTSRPFVFLSNAVPPQINITSPQNGDWVNKSFTVTGTVRETMGIQKFEYAIDTPTNWKVGTLAGTKGDIPFSISLDLADLPDGKASIFIRAVNTGGEESMKTVVVKKDTTLPVLSLVTPEGTLNVNGIFSVTGRASDNGKIDVIEFSSDGKNYVPLQGTPIFTHNLDITQFEVQPELYYIRATDFSGNVTIFNPQFSIDFQADKPRAEIQIPAREEVLRSDFLVSGMAFDDDGVAAVYYRLDGKGEFTKIEGATNSFSLPIAIKDITDNEHQIEVVAEDVNGLRGDTASSTFYISKAEPVSALTTPAIDITTRGKIKLEGTSSDANGIKSVYLSFDNGNTYHLTTGKEQWNYQFNTALLKDGVHRLLIKAVDSTDTEGLSATLINVDNTPPVLSLDRPVDGESISENLFLNGRAFDNIHLTSLTVNIAPVNQAGTDSSGQSYTLTTGGVFNKSLDMSKAKEGWYNMRIEARDKADNITYVTRNMRIEQKKDVNRVEQIFPQDGESLSGYFTLSGRVLTAIPVTELTYAIDDKVRGTLEINTNKYFSLDLGPEQLESGEHTITVTAKLSDGSTIVSPSRRIIYRPQGPWVRITNLTTGDFIAQRPWMKGEAGYYLNAPNREDKEAYTAYEREMEDNEIERIEISFDNGKSFTDIGKKAVWNYRLQTQDIPDGDVRILIRVTTTSGKTAITRLMVVNDDRPPAVNILLPEEEQRFNDKVNVLGVAADENDLSKVNIALRKGNKNSYVVPEFIQGMYIDAQARTDFQDVSWAAGLGFAFFDQNVKLQAQAGFVPSNRFGGLYLGAKLLANIFKLPFEAMFGPDFEFLSASLALGVNVSYCTNSQFDIAFTDKGLVLAAIVAQLEFPKFTLTKANVFNAYAFYTEFQVWLLSSDVVGAPVVQPRLSFGARIQLF